jgi:hypothetical protein
LEVADSLEPGLFDYTQQSEWGEKVDVPKRKITSPR